MTRMNRFWLVVFATLLGACSTLPFGADVKTAETVAEPPGDVTVHVTVEDDGEPVNYLSTSNFEIQENGVALDAEEIGLRLLPREKYAAGHTVLLLDLSGKPTPEELHRIARGASHFVEKVSTSQAVTVVAFDGSPRPRKIAEFSRVDVSTKRPLPDLAPFLSGDESRDLNGSILLSIKGLTETLTRQDRPFHYGNIVTLVRGPDLAGRVEDKELLEAMKTSGYEFFSIAPEELRFPTLANLGKDSKITYDSIESLPMRFQDLGMRVRATGQSHYFVSYCTPGRAGIRKLSVEVTYENQSGTRRSARARSEFDSTGFSGGCKPKSTSSESEATPTSEDESGSVQGGSAPTPTPDGPSPESTPGPLEEEEAEIVAPPSTGKYE